MSNATAIVATPHVADLRSCQTLVDLVDDLTLVGHAPGLMELFSQVETKPPNLVLVSADLCQTPDFELIVTLFNALDVRWTMFVSATNGAARPKPLVADRHGGLFSMDLESDTHTLIAQLRAMVLARRRAQQSAEPAGPASRQRYRRMVMLGASTGGVEALKAVLSHFHGDCPPTVVVQHTGRGFGSRLASVLARSCDAKVKMYEPNIRIERGMICVVAGQARHIALCAGANPCLGPDDAPLGSGHCPSIDRMFMSGVPNATRIAAAVLTGMGSDGAAGLLALRQAGAFTLAQDEATSVVYGMPALAWANGGAQQRVPLEKIGPTLLAQSAL